MVGRHGRKHSQASRSSETGRRTIGVIREAAKEVARPTFFGVLIIVLVYVPILTLRGVEGKMFRPMAMTVLFALAASLVIAIVVMPVLSSYVFENESRRTKPG